MKLNAKQLGARIAAALPEDSVITDHDKDGHFYKIMTPDEDGVVGQKYPSVTGKIKVIKDEGLMNYRMNRAIDYFFKNFSQINDSNLMEHLDLASRVSVDILTDAGDIGREVHDARERYFRKWIETGVNPGSALDFIPNEIEDKRINSALRALNAFISDYKYVPIATELFVYSHKLKIAGTLDDIGLITIELRPGKEGCSHEMIENNKNESICLKCGLKNRTYLTLLDLKTSNQFKDHYFFQVSLYYEMFKKLTDINPERLFILKVSKEDGTYKLEELKNISKLVYFAKQMIKVDDGINYIKSIRKDNQKVVGKLMEI